MHRRIKTFRVIPQIIFVSLLIVSLFFFSSNAKANEETSEHKTEKFNAGDLIMEHIGDAHDWHVAGHFSIPLPVILYSSEKGLSIFSSSKFEHGHASHDGYKLEKNKVVAVNEDDTINEAATNSIYDISITKNVASLLISVLLLCWIFISASKSYSKRQGMAPKGLQSLLEPIIIFVRDDIAKGSIGKKYEKFMPYLLTVFFFIWINNMLGLIPFFPGGANLTGNIAVTMFLASITFFITTFSANKNYWQHVFAMPGVPVWVLFLLTPIEILGVFLRPFVLMIRLFANILAGHIILLSFISLIFIFAEMSPVAGYSTSVVSILFSVFMSLLEVLVGFLQAYVFTLLSAIYFAAAIDDHHHPVHEEETALI